MTGNKKNILTMLLAVLMMLPVLSTTVVAATPDSEMFSIDVDMKVPNSDEVYDAQIYLYKVASAKVDENGNLHMEPVELYKDVTFDNLTQEEVRDLLDKLCERIKYPGSVPETALNLAPLEIQKPGKDGMIHFDNLDAGVYLLIKWNCEALDKLEMLPSLVYLPSYNQESGIWEYTVNVAPKFSWNPDPPPVTPPTTPDSQLPQTGMVQWPVPVLVLAGLFLLVIGYGVIRRAKQD